MRGKFLVMWCVLGLSFVSGRDANALIKYLGELSGPGPFLGTEFIFPWSLSHPNIDLSTWNHNQETLDRLGLEEVHPYADNLEEFLTNEAQLRFYAEVLEIPQDRLVQIDDILDDSTDSPVSGFQRLVEGNERLRNFATGTVHEPAVIAFLEADPAADRDQLQEGAEAVFAVVTPEAMRTRSNQLRNRIRNYGVGKLGYFTSMNALPEIIDPGSNSNTVNNFFFTVVTSVFVSVDNDLPFAQENDKNDTTYWFTAYPSLEYRFWCGNDRQNFFVSGGPAVHFFAGETFENFSRISLRGRLGFRYRRVYFGLESDWYAPQFRNEDFGAIPDLDNLDRFNVGFFFSIGLGRTLN